ncbi:hypothetical protein NSA27_02385 [Clostridium tepidum]|uniref:hypothetical protein n=1 Tax=Clostridium tepidum TaxID=1962263 RepID=UPI002149D61C|nr:hypothetical protein [Clostridium tepidum]MCR1933550.1 hypothetical protein [Clostridium tepidum]
MFYKGQLLRNIYTNVTGKFFREYKVTGCGMYVQVMCKDGRIYYAPKEQWVEEF